MLRGEEQVININSNISGADVFINNKKVGQTPFSGKVKKSKVMNIRVEKKGYQELARTYESDIDSTFWVNLLSSGPFGSTTDYSNGSMWKVNEGSIYFNLKKAGKASANFKNRAKIKHFVMTNFENITNELVEGNKYSYLQSLQDEFFSKTSKAEFSNEIKRIYKTSKSDAVVFGEEIAALYSN